LLTYVHQNFLTAVELILSKIPQETLENQWASQLQNILKNKKNKKGKKGENFVVAMRASNEGLQNILKNLVR
jgi:hypothetical protein